MQQRSHAAQWQGALAPAQYLSVLIIVIIIISSFKGLLQVQSDDMMESKKITTADFIIAMQSQRPALLRSMNADLSQNVWDLLQGYQEWTSVLNAPCSILTQMPHQFLQR